MRTCPGHSRNPAPTNRASNTAPESGLMIPFNDFHLFSENPKRGHPAAPSSCSVGVAAVAWNLPAGLSSRLWCLLFLSFGLCVMLFLFVLFCVYWMFYDIQYIYTIYTTSIIYTYNIYYLLDVSIYTIFYLLSTITKNTHVRTHDTCIDTDIKIYTHIHTYIYIYGAIKIHRYVNILSRLKKKYIYIYTYINI